MAKQSGITSRIEDANKRLESLNADLTGFNEMTSDRKAQKFIVDFTKERYKPLQTDIPKATVSIPQKEKTGSSVLSMAERVKNGISGMDKYGHFGTGSSNTVYKTEPGEKSYNYQTTVYRSEIENEKKDLEKNSIIQYSNVTSPNIDKAKKIGVVGGGSMGVNTGYVEDYQTSENDDFSKTYGTSIKRSSDSQLGKDSLQSRAYGTTVIYDNRKILKNAGDKYGVPTYVMAACVFTEQACNVTAIEGISDEISYTFRNKASFGIGQVSISAAKLVEEENIIMEPIKFVKIDKAGLVWWDVPGVGIMYGTFEDALKERLKIPEQNAEYIAAYLKYQRDIWYKETGIDLSQKPEVWMTLYNIHLGKKGYHSNPGANDFGKYGRANMYYAESVINMP